MHVEIGDAESGFAPNAELDHRAAVAGARAGRGAVRWNRGREEPHTIELQRVPGRARDVKMADVDRIERSAHETVARTGRAVSSHAADAGTGRATALHIASRSASTP